MNPDSIRIDFSGGAPARAAEWALEVAYDFQHTHPDRALMGRKGSVVYTDFRHAAQVYWTPGNTIVVRMSVEAPP